MQKQNRNFFALMLGMVSGWMLMLLAGSVLHYEKATRQQNVGWEHYNPFSYHWLMLGLGAAAVLFVCILSVDNDSIWPRRPPKEK